MRLDRDEPPAPSSLVFLTELARDARNQLTEPTPAELGEKWTAVSTLIAAQKARRKTIVRLSMAGALAAAVALAWTLPRLGSRPEHATAQVPLSYKIEGGSVVEGGYLRESGSDAIKLRFTEGTEFVLLSGTRARLRTVTSLGARIAIEHGTASFQVTPRSEARWQVDVGPFLVTVKGTVFTVSWDAIRERFELRLRRGAVSVSGPVSSGEISVKAGQRLVVNLTKKETVITEEDDGDGRGLGGAPSEDTAVHPGTSASWGPTFRPGRMPGRMPGRPASATGPKTTPAKSGVGQGWSEAVAAGQWDRVLAEADLAGVKQTLANASSEDLLALADASRYRQRSGLARAALLAERNRFPGSRSALDAAFLLGRLAESRQGEMREAAEWYDTYLAGAPRGTYAAEALGRKMMATRQLRGVAAAEALATEYLRRFPTGPYAGAAHALLLPP
jgi:hypothetical protein